MWLSKFFVFFVVYSFMGKGMRKNYFEKES